MVRRQKPEGQSRDRSKKGGGDLREAVERKRHQFTGDSSWGFYWPLWSPGLALFNPCSFLKNFLLFMLLQFSQFSPFSPSTQPIPPLPQSIPTPLSMSMGHAYMLFDYSLHLLSISTFFLDVVSEMLEPEIRRLMQIIHVDIVTAKYSVSVYSYICSKAVALFFSSFLFCII